MARMLFILTVALLLHIAQLDAYSGAPGKQWQPAGIPGSGSAIPDGLAQLISPGGGRPISPGGTVGSPGGGDIGEGGADDTNSPQQRPDTIGSIRGSMEDGVGESGLGTIRGCKNSADTLIGKIASGGNSNLMCLEMLCSSKCPGEYKKVNGCPTCQCQETVGRVISSCPDSTISSLWAGQGTNSGSIGAVVGDGVYNVKADGQVEIAGVGLERHLHNGGLCGSSVDAAFTAKLPLDSLGSMNFVVYFSGTQYSLFKNDGFAFVSGPHDFRFKLEGGSKTPLQLTFPWWVTKLDAAMTWKGKIYFFFKYHSTGYFSVYNPVSKRMGVNYPRRTIDEWSGVPLQGPDAAVSTSSGTYFAVGSQLYKLSSTGAVQKGYPKPIKGNLIRC